MQKIKLILADEDQNKLDEMVKNFSDDKHEIIATTTSGEKLVQLIKENNPKPVGVLVIAEGARDERVKNEIL